MSTIGILYPGHSAEDDYPWVEGVLREAGYAVRLPVAHTSVGEDAHRVDALLDLGGAARLAEGADRLTRSTPCDALVWACTSGSFVFGWEGAHEQVGGLAARTGLPTTSTSLAFVRAAHRLGLTRVAVAASYPHDVASAFVTFLGRAGIEVTALGSHDILTAAEVGTLGREQVLALADGVDRTGAQAVLVPDTALHTLPWLADLEAHLGTVVLTANQVSLHDGLALLGEVPAVPGLGRLFAEPRRPAPTDGAAA
ncbi:maleate cis-trans isomerase [Serinicoccus chungangensis]|uniref:Maleate cis-trans isomerase n=1 Tax=Serinicoccus chungangensis TaxID=767452 RepID=A0A0W8I7D5_9MICO|nr:maleate cis-trans isomerase [Serinicoccus chungangensis]KUG54513.1 maleate cis-trans isomerase [Serinicoccus chungangensis]